MSHRFLLGNAHWETPETREYYASLQDTQAVEFREMGDFENSQAAENASLALRSGQILVQDWLGHDGRESLRRCHLAMGVTHEA